MMSQALPGSEDNYGNHRRTPQTNPAALTAEHSLAQQMLDRLRLYQLSSRRADREIDLAVAPDTSAELLPPDKSAYAIQLGFCLAQHFPTAEALMASSAFIIILARETDDPVAMIDALYEIAAHEGARVTVNPTPNLEKDVESWLLEVEGWLPAASDPFYDVRCLLRGT